MTERMKCFLADLKELLERYDACFSDYEEYEVTFSIGASNGDREYASFLLRNAQRYGTCIDAKNFNDYLEVSND